QRALRALEQNAFALAALAVEQRPDRIHEWQHLRRNGCEVVIDRLWLDLGEPITPAERIVMRKEPVDFGPQGGQVCKIHEADRATADFVFIGRSDTALGRSDSSCRVFGFTQRLELPVKRQDQDRVFGYTQAFG